MTGMERASELIHDAVVSKKRILLYGDYDVDGLCYLMLMRKFFELLNHRAVDVVKYKIRTHHISSDVVNDAFVKKADLVIIGDTGSGEEDLREISKIQKFAKVIVCDHHKPQYNYNLADGCTYINPGYLDNFPYMSGACVAYELCLWYFNKYLTDDLEKAKKYLSFFACAALYADSIYNDNFYTKTLLKQAKKSIIPSSVNFLPYINASKRFFLFSFAPPFNACFRNNRLDLINNLLLNDKLLTSVDKLRYIHEIDRLRDYSREMTATLANLCRLDEYKNIVFTDLTGLLNQNIPNQYIRNNKGLIANILAAKYKTCAVVTVSDGTKSLLSVRDFYNRDVFKLFNPFYSVGGHPSAFGGSISNRDRLDLEDKLRFIDSRLEAPSPRNITPFSYQSIENIALANEYKQPKDMVYVRVPFKEVIEEWTPDTFSERFIQFKLKSIPIWWRKEAWYKQGSDMLVSFYYTDRIKADMIQEDI